MNMHFYYAQSRDKICYNHTTIKLNLLSLTSAGAPGKYGQINRTKQTTKKNQTT